MRREIGREESVVEGGAAKGCAGQGPGQPGLVGTTPVKTVMKQSDRWMQFAHDPLVISGGDVRGRPSGDLQIG